MDIFEKLLSEVKAQEKKNSTNIKPFPSVQNPWTKEALILYGKEVICQNCGNVAFSWEPSVFLRRTRVVRGKLHAQETRLFNYNFDEAYNNLPRYVKIISQVSTTCPLCFEFLPKGSFYSRQLYLPLQMEEEDDHEV